MSLAYNSSEVTSEGAFYRSFANLSPDNNYQTGGYPIDPKFLRLSYIEKFTVVNNPSGILFQYNPTTGKLLMGRVSGGGALGFVGDAMATHHHNLTGQSDDLASLDGQFIDISGAPGSYTIGETITGTTSGATGVVLASTAFEVRYTPGAGRFDQGEIVTGGTSGLIKTSQSLPYVGYNFNSPGACIVSGVDSDTGTRRQYQASHGIGTNLIGLVSGVTGGPFEANETVTGTTSNAVGRLVTPETLENGGIVEFQLLQGDFIGGETFTGGTSGASGTLDFFQKKMEMRVNLDQNRIEIDADIAVDQINVIGLFQTAIQDVSAGTPTGTISGGGGGGFTEFTPGFNVVAILPNFDVIVEGK